MKKIIIYVFSAVVFCIIAVGCGGKNKYTNNNQTLPVAEMPSATTIEATAEVTTEATAEVTTEATVEVTTEATAEATTEATAENVTEMPGEEEIDSSNDMGLI